MFPFPCLLLFAPSFELRRVSLTPLPLSAPSFPLLQVYTKGKAKAIGVSNWSIPKLEDLLSVCKIKPAAK